MALSAELVILSKALPKSKVMAIGPDFAPTLIGYITFALAAALTILSIKGLKKRCESLAGKEAPKCDYKRVIGSMILMLLYVCYMKTIGFIIATLVFLFLQMCVLCPDDKRCAKEIVKLAVITVIFVFAVFFLFRYGFKIVLPAGIFTINL